MTAPPNKRVAEAIMYILVFLEVSNRLKNEISIPGYMMTDTEIHEHF